MTCTMCEPGSKLLIGASSPGVNVSVPLPGSNTTPGGTSTCSPGSTSSEPSSSRRMVGNGMSSMTSRPS